MARKVTAMILAVLMTATLAGCGQQQEEEGSVEAFVPTGEIAAEGVTVDVEVNGDGHYTYLADVAVDFGEDGLIQAVTVENTALLAFSVSSLYEGGVYLYSGTEMQEVIAQLESAADAAEDEAAKELIEGVIEALANGGPIVGEST